MPIYAVAETVPERSRYYITPGKRYALAPNEWGCDERGLDGSGFAWQSDTGEIAYSLWRRCSHLNGGNWTRIEEPDESPAPDPRDALMAELAEALRACEAFLFPSTERGTGFDGSIEQAENLTIAALAKYEGANK
jgi:hypothetical protein